MSNKFSAAETDALNRDARAIAAARALGLPGILEDIYALIQAGSIGITARAIDVDAVALGGGLCTQNPNTTSGLTFGYDAGRFHNGKINVVISAGTILLAASNTNYVEVDRTGTVFSNTSGFTSGRLPLWTIVTGVSTISSITFNKPLLTLLGLAGVTGDMLSTAAATKRAGKGFGTVSATTSQIIIAPPNAGVLTAARLVGATSVTANDTNYWTYAIANKSNSNAAMLDATALNTTKATGGSAMTAYTLRNLTLSGTGGNLIVAANDILEVTITGTGSPTAMNEVAMELEFSFTA